MKINYTTNPDKRTSIESLYNCEQDIFIDIFPYSKEEYYRVCNIIASLPKLYYNVNREKYRSDGMGVVIFTSRKDKGNQEKVFGIGGLVNCGSYYRGSCNQQTTKIYNSLNLR